MRQNLLETAVTRKGEGFTGRVFPSDTGSEVVLLELEAGKSLAVHVTMMDVIFFVMEGTGSLQVGDLSVPVSAGSILDSPKGIPHGAVNSGNGPLRLLVVKLPE